MTMAAAAICTSRREARRFKAKRRADNSATMRTTAVDQAPSAIAAGIALGAWSNALALIRRGAATFGFSIDAAARRRLPRIVASALAMGGALWLTARFVPALATGTHGLAQAVLLGLVMAGGIVIYGLLLARLGVVNWRQAIPMAGQNPVRDLRD